MVKKDTNFYEGKSAIKLVFLSLAERTTLLKV